MSVLISSLLQRIAPASPGSHCPAAAALASLDTTSSTEALTRFRQLSGALEAAAVGLKAIAMELQRTNQWRGPATKLMVLLHFLSFRINRDLHTHSARVQPVKQIKESE